MIRRLLIFTVVGTLICSVFVEKASAQRRGRRTNTPTTGGTTTPATKGNATSTTTTGNAGTVVEAPGKFVDTASSDGNSKEYGATVLSPKRNNYGYEKNPISERTPLIYDNIREDDAAYSVFVWREIDAREKMNQAFTYSAKEENGDQRFFSILLGALKNDSVTAFSSDDDRFTTPLSYADVINMSSAKGVGFDTLYQPSINNPDIYDTIVVKHENKRAPKPDSVYIFRIKEQWIFDKETSKMYTRIIGIAPLMPDFVPGAKNTKGPSVYVPMFWLYYPDLRPTLAKAFVYNAKNSSARMTWEDLFESRMFGSYIVKSSLDNPKDQSFKAYIKDPLFQLLEGESVKEKIFNYEQALWSY